MQASLRNIRITPKKLNLVAELVRGESALKAITLLSFTPKRAALPLKKLIQSAVANAENNFNQSAKNLMIRELKVSKSFTLKRGVSGSRGRVEPMLKRTSHAHVYLEASSQLPVASSKKPVADSKKTKTTSKPKAASNKPQAIKKPKATN
jgi:large subunit ribosomal protein L22